MGARESRPHARPDSADAADAGKAKRAATTSRVPGAAVRAVLLLLLATAAFAPARAQRVETLHRGGPPANRVNIAFLGDGYTQAEIATRYAPIAKGVADFFFGDTALSFVYSRYRNFFNFYRIDFISSRSGIGWGTALEAESGCSDLVRQICQVNWKKANAAFDAALRPLGIRTHLRIISLNGTGRAAAHTPGGSAPNLVVTYHDGPWVALHESAHAWHRLGDEYSEGLGAYAGEEPEWPNLTRDPSAAKWKHWIGFTRPGMGAVGAYNGGMLYESGVYRPTYSSMMGFRGRNTPHHAVSMEKMILDIYRIVNPVDEALPTRDTLIDPARIWVKLVDPGVSRVDWYVDGQLVAVNGGEEFNPRRFRTAPGRYLVRARVYDEAVLHAFSDNRNPHRLDLVRKGLEELRKDLTWTVRMTPNAAAVAPAATRPGLSIAGVDARAVRVRVPAGEPFALEVFSPAGARLGTVFAGTSESPEAGLPWNGAAFGSGLLLLKLSQGPRVAWMKWAGAGSD